MLNKYCMHISFYLFICLQVRFLPKTEERDVWGRPERRGRTLEYFGTEGRHKKRDGESKSGLGLVDIGGRMRDGRTVSSIRLPISSETS
jgi:hypothetical protein